MSDFQRCNIKAMGRDTSSAVALQHLMGPAALKSLEASDRDRLESARWLVRTIGKGRSIIDQGETRESIFILLSGWAFRSQTLSDGKRQILDFVFAGTLLGFGSCATNSYGVETVTECRVASLSIQQFKRLLSQSPALAIEVAERLCDSEMRAHEHMTSLGRRNARERIAGLVVELAARTPIHAKHSLHCSLELPVTQVMIGDALGLSNEHVCRVIGKLAEAGVIGFAGQTLEVLDQHALLREAGYSEEEAHSAKLIAIAA